MEFKKFAQLMHPVIGGASSTHAFVKTLFDAIITDDGLSVLEEITEETYKAYFNGNTGISRIARKISLFIEPEEFIEYCNQFSDATMISLCDSFRPHLPEITPHNAGELLANLFQEIIKTAASVKRKRTTKSARQAEQARKEKIRKVMEATGAVVVEKATSLTEQLLGEPQDIGHIEAEVVDSKGSSGAASKGAKPDANGSSHGSPSCASIDLSILSADDLSLLKEFRAESRDLLLYIIKNDPSAGPTEITLSDDISGLIEKWQFSVREIEDSTFRKLVLDILNTLREYTYYISEVFLRYIPGRDILWFRNESWEEGNRLRNELQPKSYELRCAIARLYERLYPIPEDAAQDRSETIEAEAVDDEEPSGAATEDKKITVIQQQINVVQNGENNFNLTNNGTMNFDLKGGGV